MFEYIFEYHEAMDSAPEPVFPHRTFPDPAPVSRTPADRTFPDPAPAGQASADQASLRNVSGVLKAMSPGVVDFLFRRLVAGEAAEDVHWHREGVSLSVQPPGAELARRLSETDLDALTPTELFHYVRAAQRLAGWAEALREEAVGRYCAPPPGCGAPPA